MAPPTPMGMSLSKLWELVMPSNHLILCHSLLLLPLMFASIRVFFNKSVLCLRWPKYWPKYSFIGKSKILGSSFSESKFVSFLLLSSSCLLETWNKSALSYCMEIFCVSPLYSWPSILVSMFFPWRVVSPFTILVGLQGKRVYKHYRIKHNDPLCFISIEYSGFITS